MNDANDKKLTFKELIAKNLGRAIVSIQREIDTKSPIYNDLILNKRRYFQTENDFNRGAISIDDRDKVFNQVSNSLINLIEEIGEKDIKEYNNIQKEIEAFNSRIKEYEENSKTIETAIFKVGEDIKTYLISGIVSLEGISESIEKLINKTEIVSEEVNVSREKRIEHFNEAIRRIENILISLQDFYGNQKGMVSEFSQIQNKSLMDIEKMGNELSYTIQKQTKIYSELIENLIDNNAINSERIIAAFESVRNDKKEKGE